MKRKNNYDLLKIIGIAFLLFVVLTWIIPTGSYTSGQFTKGETTPVGLYGIFTTPVYSFAVFAQYFILILCIGGFYGVLNKTGVYQQIIEKLTKRFGKKRNIYLVITILIFSLITSLFSETMMIFILLPFFITVLLKLDFDKLTAIASTVGASLIGMIANITGNLAIYKNYFGIEPKTTIIFNIIMYVVLVFLLSAYIISKNIIEANNKKEKKKNKKETKPEQKEEKLAIPLYVESKNTKKSIVPMIIILTLTLIVIMLGLYNWYYSFDINVFNDLYEKITTIELFGTNIISKIFGQLPIIGSFSNYDVSAILLISSIAIAWIYSIKTNEFIESFKTGMKKILLPATYVILASVIFSSVVTASSGNISITISNFILNLSNNFNVLTGTLTAMIGSFFYNDYLYLINGLYSALSLYDTNMMPVILFIFQSMFGIMMFILPVSITIIGILKYLEVSYKDWIKYIWKLLIQIFAISIIGSIILSMLV